MVQAILKKYEEECRAAVDAFRRELQKVRTGRASGSVLEGIVVEYYGTKTALSHLGQITTPEARLIVIQVYDSNAAVAVEKAIHSAGLGFNPSREGNTIRIVVPPLTEETRREIVKHLHKMAEDYRVSVRNHRRDANDAIKKLEKEGTVAKDEAGRVLEKVQKQTDASISDIDKVLAQKEAECMEV